MTVSRKKGYLGPAFHHWLEWLEQAESVVFKGKNPRGNKPIFLAMNTKAFGIFSDEQFRKVTNESVKIDAYLARVVRSSVKYKISWDTIQRMFDTYGDEVTYLYNTLPIRLPFKWCTLVIDGFDSPSEHSYVVSLQEEVTPSEYPALGLTEGEEFICANMVGYKPSGLDMAEPGSNHELSHIPVEIHLSIGRTLKDMTAVFANQDNTHPDQSVDEQLKMVLTCIMAWICSLHLASVLKTKQAGLPPACKDWAPKRPRKKHQFPKFEHIITELPFDEVPSEQTGRSVIQPRKRLHQVRGFYRHYKSGKVVWVKPHWRGNKELGVVRHDYEMTMKEGTQDEST